MSRKKTTPQLLTLAAMAEFLTEKMDFGDPDYAIAYMTPYDWWWRRRTIDPPFPKPVQVVGGKKKHYLFDAEEIWKWYQDYKGIA